MMKIRLYQVLPIALSILVTACQEQHATAAFYPVNLTVEYLHEPTHIDIPNPRFSWQFTATDSTHKNLQQTAYRLLVASSAELLDKNQGDLWDTQKQQSSQSTLIRYNGKPLVARQKYYWKVRIWDQDRRISSWSAASTWSMALLGQQDWQQAKWIGMQNDHRHSELRYRQFETFRSKTAQKKKPYPSPFLRKVFTIDKPIAKATAYVVGLGYHEFYVNGKKTSDRVLDPGQTNYDKTAFYITHDISKLLQNGKNALGIWLGNGFFGQSIAFDSDLDYGQPRAIAMVYLDYSDGTTQTIITDQSWKTAQSPILFDNVYGGETYDARLTINDWSDSNYDDREWQNAAELKAPGKKVTFKSQLLEPIRRIEYIQAKQIWKTSNGRYVFDFGKNIAGWLKLTINESAETIISIETAEALDKNKKNIDNTSIGHFATGLKQIYSYIASGRVNESWEPKFSYHGFQYAEVNGLTSPPSKDTIQAVLVHTDVNKHGNFHASSDIINQIYDASMLTAVANMHSVPEDCPHREKCGWLGDAHSNAEALLYNFDLVHFYLKFMDDIRDGLIINEEVIKQNPNSQGIPPFVAPGKRVAIQGALDWQIAIIYLPYYLYLHTGDLSIFKKFYPHMQDFIEFHLHNRNDHGLIEDGFGDWCPPRWDKKTAPQYMVCKPMISANAMFYQGLNILEEMSIKLEDKEYSSFCNKNKRLLKQAFNDAYYENIENTKYKYYGSQTATVMALRFGLAPEEDREQILQALLYDINELYDGHHTTGMHGLRHFYTTLAENGLEQLAFKMYTDPTFPSPAYIIYSGLNTWPERQWEWDKLATWERSLSHPYYSQVATLLHENILGIKIDRNNPGYKHFILRPQFTEQLQWAKGYTHSLYGKISSDWKVTDQGLIWNLGIPINSSATVSVPLQEDQSIYIDRAPAQGADFIEHGRQWATFELGSGDYAIEVK